MRTARDDALDERLVPRAAVDDVLEALRRVEDHDLVAPVGRVAGPRELRHLLDGELVADVEAGVHAQRRDEARLDDQEPDREADGQRLAVDAQVLGELLVAGDGREPAGPLVGGRVVVAAARAPRDGRGARRAAQAAEPRRRREGRRARDEQGERRVAAAHDCSARVLRQSCFRTSAGSHAVARLLGMQLATLAGVGGRANTCLLVSCRPHCLLQSCL